VCAAHQPLLVTAVNNKKAHGVGTLVIMIFLRHLNFEEIEIWAKCKNKIKHEISKDRQVK
jgi:adenosine deaminase